MQTLTRRSMLRGIGVSMALPLLQRDAEAAPASDPAKAAVSKRMVCIANPLGFVPDYFFPDKTGTKHDLPQLLRPLRSHRGNFTVFSNLDHGVSGGHQGVHAFLSGIRDNESAQWANRNQTIDQRAAEMVGSRTRYSSIVASVGHNTDELECRTSWTRTGVNVPPVTKATELFEALFVSEDKQGKLAKRAAFDRHASILDAVGSQAKTLHRSLGKIDREKLDEYLTSVRSVEAKLKVADEWLDRPKPDIDRNAPAPGQAFTSRLPLFYDLIKLALQTDSTRVATLCIPGNLPVADLGLQGNYHAFSHHGKSQKLLDPLLQIEGYQMKQFARFLDSLPRWNNPAAAHCWITRWFYAAVAWVMQVPTVTKTYRWFWPAVAGSTVAMSPCRRNLIDGFRCATYSRRCCINFPVMTLGRSTGQREHSVGNSSIRSKEVLASPSCIERLLIGGELRQGRFKG